jgi:hypothetical protein
MKIYVFFNKSVNKWESREYNYYKYKYIGRFDTKEEALLGLNKEKPTHNVTFDKKNSKWKATKQIDGKQVFLGFFNTEKDAKDLTNRIRKEQRYPYIKNNICYIPLPNGEEAFCDEDRLPEVLLYNWSLANGYVNAFIKKQNRREKLTHFLYPETNLFIDHINHNVLDNRSCNLRMCTNAENRRNSQKPKTNTSGYKGVFYRKTKNDFVAGISFNKKTKHIGCFLNAIDAAKAYDKKAKELFGEFACLNFPEIILISNK